MASYYWAKVWIEILYDYKMASMSDHLWRRTIELVLLAKERNAEGYLPKLEEMAFKLRTNAEILEAELNDLAGFEIAERRQDGWYLINFADRQGKMEVAERVARHRDREKKREYNEPETVVQRDGNENVTNRYTEQNRIDKKRKEKIKRDTLPPLPSIIASPAMMTKWGEWCQYQQDKGHPLVYRTAKVQQDSFAEWGEARSIAAMDFSIAQGYKGLIEPKGTGNSKRPSTLDNSMAAIKRALGD